MALHESRADRRGNVSLPTPVTERFAKAWAIERRDRIAVPTNNHAKPRMGLRQCLQRSRPCQLGIDLHDLQVASVDVRGKVKRVRTEKGC
jgi:hypothetical protein